MIVNNHKLIFIHIPKCGGTSILNLLEKKYYIERFNRRIGHSTYIQYKERMGDEINNYKIFTVIRNPWDWHVSHFHYLKSVSPIMHGHGIEHKLFNQKNFSFTDYIHWLIDKSKNKSSQGFLERNQFDWCVNEKGKFMVNHILNLENYHEDYKNFCALYGIKENIIPHMNISKHDNYRKYYNSETKKIIEKKHEVDINYFKYKF